ncbi:MAG: transposase, partial [Nitrosopumilus sp.]
MKLSKYLVALAFAIIISALFFTTIDLTDVLEKMCGLDISSTQVSRVAKLLDEQLGKWRSRLL